MYPPLAPPEQFQKPRAEWSRSEARAVLAWLVALIEPRTDRLLSLLGMSWPERPTGWLDVVESGVPSRIWSDEFWREGDGRETIVLRGHAFQQDAGPSLTGLGEALGADLGLLLARSFSRERGSDARWIVAGHGRTNVSHNLPVLRGRGKAEFDPLLIGLNVAARWIPGAARNPHQLGLAALHDRWLADLENPDWGRTPAS